jgi:hypothetical protein
MTHPHPTPPPSSSQVNGYTPHIDAAGADVSEIPTLREEASARQGSYWAGAPEANYSPIGGRKSMSLECAHLGLVAGTSSSYQANIGKPFFLPPDSCSICISEHTCGMRVPICMLTLCVIMTPSPSLPCSAKRKTAEGSWGEMAEYGGGMCGSRRMSGVWSGKWQGAPIAQGGAGSWVDEGGDERGRCSEGVRGRGKRGDGR